jgi:peptide/nickel transport system substrate-binding protein
MKMKKIVALVLALVMCLTVFAGCSAKKQNETPVVIGYSEFNSKFSPFFSETAYDQDVWKMTSVLLLTQDRTGAIIEKGIEGETKAYNGTDYTYYGPADLNITTNDDGTVYYDFTIRDDMTFSDGEKLTVDDVIFSMYVESDPTFDGGATFFSLPIQGMEEYRSGMESLMSLLLAAGRDNKEFKYWDEATQKAFWADLDKGGAAFAQEIVDYCVENGYGKTVAEAAAAWGFDGLKDDATAKDFFYLMVEGYENDLVSLSSTETAGSSLAELMDNYDAYTKGVETGESAANITGIQKTGDNSLRVILTEVDAQAIYQFAIPIAPMHYYGDASLYNYDNNQFGFTKGDLSIVKSKTTEPMGAGPFKFIKFENGVVNFEANDSYYLGKPASKYINFQQTTDADKLNGVITGTIDLTDPSYSVDTVKAIKAENSNGEVTGDKINTVTVDNLGYGYLGIDAKRVNVGGEPGSDASKNLRKALGTVFAAYRDVSVDSYYGDTAEVINYPISNTSWAAPQQTDADYAIAFSKDVNGKDIYTSDMDADARYAAALKASLGFFEAAGYTVKDGKVTAAPKDAKMEFEAWIPADGSGDHPSFMLLTEASKAFKTIGIKVNVKDLANSSDLWTALEADSVDIWCAAWGATPDPDMYQVYFSGDDKNAAGGNNYMYDINDKELNQLILDARKNMDQSYRKTVYKQCLDIIVDWAVEIPVYQRQNAFIFSSERVNMDSVTHDITTYYGWIDEVWTIEHA